uniref:CUB domain-containing protein n=2 Tax=Macrostomum lignano TaxID=282301 RepID=A0A1I8GZV0_9PLAT
MDSFVTDQIETQNKVGTAYSVTTSPGCCYSSASTVSTTYYMFPIKKGCRMPLFDSHNSQIEVSFDASSSNYRRNANYSLAGAATDYADHLKCTVVGNDYEYYDYGVTMTYLGHACRPWSATYIPYNRSCVTVSVGAPTKCQAQGSGTEYYCQTTFNQLLCARNYQPIADPSGTFQLSITWQKAFYYNDARVASPAFAMDTVTLSTGSLPATTPDHYWRLVADMKSSHHIISGVVHFSPPLNNFTVLVSNEWNTSLGELAHQSWALCYTYNLPEAAASPLKFWCERPVSGRYVAFLQGAAVGRLSITVLQLYGEEG